MGQPVLRLGSQNEKLFPLVGAQSPTSTTYAPAAAAIPTAGGDQSVAPPAWMGVATHQTGMTAGSFTGGAGATNYTFGTAPAVLTAGLGADAGSDASRVVRALRTTEGGVLRVIPSGNWDASGNWRAPYTGGIGFTSPPSSTTSHTAFTAAVGGGLRAYVTQIIITIKTTIATGDVFLFLEDASGGTVQWSVWLPIALPVGVYIFAGNVLARSTVAGTFFIGMTTTAAATGSIAVQVHGYTSADAN